jgi:RNA polymerase sigma-70 factor (ECF subfamily)
MSKFEDDQHEEKDDETLVAEALSGQRESFRTLVTRYQAKVVRIAHEILKNRADAEDVAQEVFVKAFLSLGTYKGQSAFYTWLYRITYNMAIDFRRKMNRRGGVHVELRGDGIKRDQTASGPVSQDGGSLVSSLETPDRALERKQLRDRLAEALESLSEEHRTVVTLREIDGLSYEDIALVLGIPRGTVMSRLHYARKTIQQFLEHRDSPQKSGEAVGSDPAGGLKAVEAVELPSAAEVVHGGTT